MTYHLMRPRKRESAQRASFPPFADQQIEQGRALIKRGDFKEAIVFLERAHRDYPRDLILYNLLGTALRKDGQYACALQIFEYIHRRRPEQPSALYEMSVTYGEMGHYKDMEYYAKRATQLRPGHVLFETILADAQICRRDFDAALTTLNAQLDRNREGLQSGDRKALDELNKIHLVLSKWYRQQEKIETSKPLVQGVLDRDPDNMGAVAQLGVLHLLEGRPDEAEVQFRLVAARRPGDRLVHKGLVFAAELYTHPNSLAEISEEILRLNL